MTVNQKVWVSDVIKGEQSQWKRGDFVIINAGTGTGKSHFVGNELYDEAHSMGERILFISNRNKLKDKNKHDLKGKEETITTINYQAIETAIIRDGSFNFDMYKYVVCDECHYFLTDSMFNINNDTSLNAILKIKNSVVIFMSATGDSFFDFIRKEHKERLFQSKYYIKRDYSRLRKVAFFDKDEALKQFIEKSVKEDEKVLYFCNNVEKIYNLSIEYKDSLFIYSDPFVEVNGEMVKKSVKKRKNDKYAEFLDRDAIIDIVKSKKLNHRFTFTTTTLDNGVDFFGKDLKWIILDDIRDFDTMVQCVGRKRFIEDDPDDKVSVIIRNVNNMALGAMLTRKSKTLKEVNTFIKKGTKAWIEVCDKYSNSDFCIYDTPQKDSKYGSDKRVNLAKYEKINSDCHIISKAFETDKSIREFEELNGKPTKKIAFIRYVLSLFKKNSYRFLDAEIKRDNISKYLDSIVGKHLYKDDQQELCEKINTKNNGRLMKSQVVLNGSLQEMGLDYLIKPPQKDNRKVVDGEPNPNRNKHYWIVYKMVK
jgi:hypothetical protein